MQEPVDETSSRGDEFRSDELRFRARLNPRLREGYREGRASRLMLVMLLFAAAVFVASAAVYFVNQRALTHEPESSKSKPAKSPTSRIVLPPGPIEDATGGSPARLPDEDGSALYKCKSPGGATSYTNTPCAATEETVWVRSVRPDTTAMPSPPTAPVVRPSEAREVYSEPEMPSEREVRRAQCANAKQYEADVRRRRGLKITFDELRQLSDMVYEACKGL